MHMCVYVHRDSKSNDTPITISTPSTQIMASKYYSSLKGTGILGEVADSRAKEEQLGLPKNKESWGQNQNRYRSPFEGLLGTKPRANWHQNT